MLQTSLRLITDYNNNDTAMGFDSMGEILKSCSFFFAASTNDQPHCSGSG